MQNNNGIILFDSKPRIVSFASAAGKKEAEGPLREEFDRIISDSYAGMPTFEQGESELSRIAIREALGKASLEDEDIGAAFCGDLLNQCVASSYAVNGMRIPYAGIYGACSTMALGLILSAVAVDSGAVRRALCAASSHYCTAERQYRFPLEYGSQRPPTSQWTVTGAGACVIEANSESAVGGGMGNSAGRIVPNTDMPYIRGACIGMIHDMGMTDQNNMGAAMAPADVK